MGTVAARRPRSRASQRRTRRVHHQARSRSTVRKRLPDLGQARYRLTSPKAPRRRCSLVVHAVPGSGPRPATSRTYLHAPKPTRRSAIPIVSWATRKRTRTTSSESPSRWRAIASWTSSSLRFDPGLQRATRLRSRRANSNANPGGEGSETPSNLDLRDLIELRFPVRDETTKGADVDVGNRTKVTPPSSSAPIEPQN